MAGIPNNDVVKSVKYSALLLSYFDFTLSELLTSPPKL